MHPFREGNGRTQREFIKCLARINGIEIDLADVNKDEMIIASHESINGHYEKLLCMFKANSTFITKQERINYIELYCDNKIKDIIKNYVQC